MDFRGLSPQQQALMMNMAGEQDKIQAMTVGNLVDNYNAGLRADRASSASELNAQLDYIAAMRGHDISQQNADTNVANARTNQQEAWIKQQRLGLDRQIEASQALLRDAETTKNQQLASKYGEEVAQLQRRKKILDRMSEFRYNLTDMTDAERLELGNDPTPKFTTVPGSRALVNTKEGTLLEVPEELMNPEQGGSPALNEKRQIELQKYWGQISAQALKPVNKDGDEVEGGGVQPATLWNGKAPGENTYGFIVRGAKTERFDFPLNADGTQVTLDDVRKIALQNSDGTVKKLSANDQMRVYQFVVNYAEENDGEVPSSEQIAEALKER